MSEMPTCIMNVLQTWELLAHLTAWHQQSESTDLLAVTVLPYLKLFP